MDSITNSAAKYEAKNIKKVTIVLRPNPPRANIEGIINGPVPNITFIIVNIAVKDEVNLNFTFYLLKNIYLSLILPIYCLFSILLGSALLV